MPDGIWSRRALVAEMRERDFSLNWIADACGVSRQTVCADLKALQRDDAPERVAAARAAAGEVRR